MNCSPYVSKLSEFLDGELAPAAAAAVAEHLDACANCRARLASLRQIREAAAALPKELTPPRTLWTGIESRIASRDAQSPRSGRDSLPATRDIPARHSTAGARAFTWLGPAAIAASLALLVTVADRRAGTHLPKPSWAVASIAGTPRVNSAPIVDSGQLRPGEWLVTDGTSRAKVSVGSIGEVSVEPNSRLRLARASATDHRLELARGELNAFIWAPPRLFFVDTPSATAVDLGCAYSLRVDDSGGSELRVSSGYVALEHAGRESIIPAGWMCLTRPGVGPGTPFLADAPPSLRQALEQFDFQPRDRADALDRVLKAARADDGILLWHLLGRTRREERGAVFDALARHHPPPAGISRDGIVSGSHAMRAAWAAELGLHVGTFASGADL